MKILLIEDEPDLARNISEYLRDQFTCEAATTYEVGKSKISNYRYDCILLDLMLPGGNGLDLLKYILDQQECGVIIISARGSVEDKIKGLHLGADDYLAKPFHLSELSARILSVTRRKVFDKSNILKFQELTIDLPAQKVLVNNDPLLLTRKEFELLLFLIANKNRVISKSALAEHLSGDMADMLDNHDFVYTHVKNLKKKLQQVGCQNYIHSVYGVGYKWEL